MKVGLYLERQTPFASEIFAALILRGHEIIEKDLCICKQQEFEEQVVVTHPHYDTDCYKDISQVIDANPDIKFYIIAVNCSERQQIIGEHPNCGYLDAPDLAYFLKDPDKFLE